MLYFLTGARRVHNLTDRKRNTYEGDSFRFVGAFRSSLNKADRIILENAAANKQ